MNKLFEEAELGPLTLRNRIIKSATFEGVTPHGAVTEDLARFHSRVASGGAAMTTVAYMAVAPEGRTHAECLLSGASTTAELREFTDQIHSHGAVASVQLGHAGPVANAASNQVPAISAGRMFNPLGMRFTNIARQLDIDRIVDDYVRAAESCIAGGFDALEIHLGHNYLLSAFLSPLLNKRSDNYGGTLANRARFAMEVLTAVRGAVGDRAAITAKMNMVDGYRGGLALGDSLELASWIEAEALVDAVELTAGSSLMNPMFLFKGDAPVSSFRRTLPWYLRPGFALVGGKFLKSYPYEEGYFTVMAQKFRARLSLPIILLGGVSDLATAEQAIADGFDFVAMARALLYDPGLVNAYESGEETRSGCIHCNLCMTTIYTGTHCPIADPWPGDRIPPELLSRVPPSVDHLPGPVTENRG